jgi:hypothetical protein
MPDRSRSGRQQRSSSTLTGAKGKEFAVEVFVDVDIIPGSVRDMIQVTVDDATVNVFGTAIPGLEVEFQR